MPDIHFRDMPAMTLAAVPHRGAYHEIAPAFEALGRILGEAGAFPETRGWLGVYHDDPDTTPQADLRSHAAAIWAGEGPVPDGLEELTLPGGRYAVLVHEGPYDGLAASWGSLTHEAIGAAGGEMRDAPSLEIYLNDPGDTAPEDLRTELCVAVA